jgi:hypothetical protein
MSSASRPKSSSTGSRSLPSSRRRRKPLLAGASRWWEPSVPSRASRQCWRVRRTGDGRIVSSARDKNASLDARAATVDRGATARAPQTAGVGRPANRGPQGRQGRQGRHARVIASGGRRRAASGPRQSGVQVLGPERARSLPVPATAPDRGHARATPGMRAPAQGERALHGVIRAGQGRTALLRRGVVRLDAKPAGGLEIGRHRHRSGAARFGSTPGRSTVTS